MNHPEERIRPSLTAAVVVPPGEETWIETVASAGAVADEIVVFGVESSDGLSDAQGTSDLSFVDEPWSDDFAAARNACLRHATGDFVLLLEAGEAVGADDAAAIRQFIADGPQHNCAFMMLVRAAPADLTESAEQVAQIRLVPRRDDVVFSGRLRDRMVLPSASLRLEAIPWRIERKAAEHDATVRARRARRDLILAQKEQTDRGRPTAKSCLVQGESHSVLGELPLAADAFRRAIELAPPESTEMLEGYYGLLTCLESESGDVQSRVAVCTAALEVFPLDSQLHLAMAGCMQAMGRADLALRCYDIAYRHGQVNPCAWHLEEVAAMAAACASLLLQIDGKHAEAAQLLGDAIESDPSSMRLGRQLLRLLVDEGKIDEALAQLDAMPAEIPNREALRTAIRGACLVSKQNWIPAFAHLQTAYEAGCRDAICLRALTLSLFAGGQLDAAERMAHTWRQHAPRDAEAGTYLEAIALRNAEATEATPQGAESSRTIRVDPALAPHAGSTPAHYPVGESVRPGFSEPIKRIKDA